MPSREFKRISSRYLNVDFDAYFHHVYENYEKYAVIPLLLVLGAITVLGYGYVTTAEYPYVMYENGSFSFSSSDMMEKGIEFDGGTEVQAPLPEEISVLDVERAFSERGFEANAMTGTTGDGEMLMVEVREEIDRDEAMEILRDLGLELPREEVSINTVSASVSAAFFTQAMIAVVLAFTIMSLVIFTAFKDVTPSVAVVFAAAGDIMISLAVMYLLGIPLTLASIAALLMLIGYSVDTDIVLSARVLKKRRGSLEERIWSSVKTGITMSLGGIVGFSILYVASHLLIGAPSTFSQIAAVMVIGLLADIPLTWLGNAYILKRYVEDGWQIPAPQVEKVIPWT